MAVKNKTNWFYIVLGLFFILGWFFSIHTKEINESDLISKTLVVYKNIHVIKGHRGTIAYRIYTTNYKSSFVIKRGAGNWEGLDSIRNNDTLLIKIHNKRLADLNDKTEEIPIYSLVKNGIQVYSLENYNSSQSTYNMRWGTIFILMGLLFFLRGFQIISSKAAYILGGLCISIIITLRLLDLW